MLSNCISLQDGVDHAEWLLVKEPVKDNLGRETEIVRKVRTIFTKDGPRIWVSFPYNKALLEEIKVMDGARWHGFEDPPIKKWSIRDSQRNMFQISYLAGKDPYAWYDRPLLEYKSNRTPYAHQLMMTRVEITYHYVIIGAEMGTGKTLAAIEALEYAKPVTSLWVSPKSALNSTYLELDKWNAKVRPELLTYDGLKKVLENWTEGQPPPQFVIFDECSRAKNPTAQRSQAVKYLADQVRNYWGDNGYVIEMSGSPAPKNPGDWWHLCEIACPGFIREGTHQKFVYRLAITEKKESTGGGFYSQILGWKDSVERCSTCGKMLADPDHDLMLMAVNPHIHVFQPCKNEVSYLYERMKGLVHVWFKKDCLDLPDKQYRLIKLKPSLSTINAAKIIQVNAPSAVMKLTRLRELSDGFQYKEEKTGTKDCEDCGAKGTIGDDPCIACGGKGQVDVFTRTTITLPTPKEDALIDLLDEHSEVGRLVVYAAYTAAIDRVVEICQKQAWDVIRVDGRGWMYFGDKQLDDLTMLKTFQREGGFDAERVCFIGHPGSAGMGLTLTQSPTIVYWSNDFNAESRIQSEDRIHRAGMDTTRGATIIDLIHLPTDALVLENLKKKRDLQSLTMGELQQCLEHTEVQRL